MNSPRPPGLWADDGFIELRKVQVEKEQKELLIKYLGLVDSLRVELHRRMPRQILGQIGVDVESANFDDDVRVTTTLRVPAYCYIVALNPNGTIQLCYPKNGDTSPRRLARLPADITSFEDDRLGFSLTDGVGQQVFILAASFEPLPPFREWMRQNGRPPWKPSVLSKACVFDGYRYRSFDKSFKIDSEFVEICEFFKYHREFDTIRAVTFPVKK